jgi:hypothetical protein
VRVGIDIDTWKLTFCAVSEEVVLFEQAKIRAPGQSLFDALQGIAAALFTAVTRLGVEPDEVYIERGRGMHRKGEYELGAIYGATAVAVRRRLPNAHIETVTVAEWKKAVTAAIGIKTARGAPGNGNAPKPVANAACAAILQARGFTLEQLALLSADHLDAFGIVWSVGPQPEPGSIPPLIVKPEGREVA